MRLKGLALLAALLTFTHTPVQVSGQATHPSDAKRTTSPRVPASSSHAPQTASSPNAEAGSSSAKGDCNGGPCEDQQRPVIVTLPAPVPEVWSWHARVLWAALVLLPIVGYAGIWLCLSALKKIERQTASAATAATAAAISAQAALLNAQATIDAERPWLLITVEPSPGIENLFTIMVTNRGRTPATIIATAEGTAFAVDESYLPRIPGYGEPSTPRIPIILLSGESTAIKTFGRDEGRRICESEERFKRVANWEEKVFILGKVVYKDLISSAEKQTHETAWCCWYIHGRQKSGLVLAGPPSYNSHT
jgi:hypothetical protein